MMGTNACYSCGKLVHMLNHCPNRISHEQGKSEFNLMVQVKSLQGGNESSHSSLGVQEKAPLVKYQVRSLN